MNRTFFLLLIVLLTAMPAWACQIITGVPDYNCDGVARVGFIGDSIVTGQGDTLNKGKGGYVKRFSERKQNVSVKNYGVASITTRGMLSNLKRGNYQPARATDVVIIDIGRNDCRTGNSSQNTPRDIRRIVKWARKNLRNDYSQPFVVVATQIPNINYRRPCIAALNQRLLSLRSKDLPVYLRYDRLPTSILSSDGLHPTSSGYAVMSNALLRFFNGRLLNLTSNSELN